ncbi:MAG: hypothetical protein R2831_04550 [Chitinophagaceae bacterium]
MKKRTFLIILVFCSTYLLQAQSKEGNTWVLGTYGIHLDFNNLPPTQDSTLLYYHSNYTGQLKGSAISISNICDSQGQVRLICDGTSLFNGQGQLIANGDTLVPSLWAQYYQGTGNNYSQTSLILPFPQHRYTIVTPVFSDSAYTGRFFVTTGGLVVFDQLMYHVVDMQANGGQGQVIKKRAIADRNQRYSMLQMGAVRHANGRDWWVLKMDRDSVNVHSYLFTPDSVYVKSVFRLPYSIPLGPEHQGQMMFSDDGSKWVSASDNYSSQVYFGDFNRCTGQLSGVQEIKIPPIFSTYNNAFDSSTSGVCYSPNKELLYVSRFTHIFQYHIASQSWYTVHGPDTPAIGTGNILKGYNTIYPGQDGKLYIGNWHSIVRHMSVIDNPNAQGAACNFCRACFRNNANRGVAGCYTQYVFNYPWVKIVACAGQ